MLILCCSFVVYTLYDSMQIMVHGFGSLLLYSVTETFLLLWSFTLVEQGIYLLFTLRVAFLIAFFMC